MNKLSKLLKGKKPVIGMIHLQALPGTPDNKYSPDQIIEITLNELAILENAGVDAIMIENMHDRPYLNRNVDHEITASMAILAYAIRNKTRKPIGIQVLAGANKAALAVAHAANLEFIRAEGFVFSHIADEGFMNSDAGELLRYRKQIGAENILIFTDIKKKHSSHAITSDISVSEMAKAAEFFKSDGIILTGKSTAEEIDIEDAKCLKNKLSIPVIAGSGITNQNIEKYYNLFDAFIVGSYLKTDGIWSNDPDKMRIMEFMEIIEKHRAN